MVLTFERAAARVLAATCPVTRLHGSWRRRCNWTVERFSAEAALELLRREL